MTQSKKNIVAIIQARLSSSRLPQKVMLPLNGKVVLEHVIDRIKLSRLINEVVVATTNLAEDDQIVEWCQKNNVQFFRGELSDVLNRFYHAANKYNATHIVRVTSDNPLIDPAIIDETIQLLINEDADYSSNNLVKTFPHGLDVEVFTFSSLEKAYKNVSLPFEKEHVTQYIRHRPNEFKLVNLKNTENVHDIRLTLDEKEDFELIEIIHRLLNDNYSLVKIVELFKKYPSLRKINSDSKQRHQVYNDSQNIV